jgi:uncharacterized Fe-S center protein
MQAISFINQENICRALASAAYGVLSTFKSNKTSYVSFAKDITQYCDCVPLPGKKIIQDTGIFASDSPVSIDAAFLDMVDYKIFNKLSGIDCMSQIKEAKKIGIPGQLRPQIIKL